MSKTTTIKDQASASVQAAASATGSTSARRGRRVDPNSALSQARVLYRAAHRHLTRAQMVDAFTQELAISRPVANTYFHLIAGPKGAEAQPAVAANATPTRARRKKTAQAAGTVARGPGRPKGSKNKPKATTDQPTAAAA